MTVKITRGLGFTLMEVMLVVVIVAILAAVAVPSWRCSLYVLFRILTPPDNQDFALLGSWL